MRILLVATLIFSLTTLGLQWYQDTARLCPIPVYYSIGRIDEQFAVSSDVILRLAQEAEAAWEEVAGIDLFVYRSDATFSINLLYDERQRLAVTQELWQNELDALEQESTARMEEVTSIMRRYEAALSAYENKKTVYERRLAIYNERVDAVNQSGGAGEEQFSELTTEQAALDQELQQLATTGQVLQDSVETINTEVAAANRLVEDYNREVQRYNEIYGEPQVFTQGDYTPDEINIYKFTNEAELRHVIAHEFGHALGIDHVADEDAVMYYLSQEQPGPLMFSTTDRDAVLALCGEQNGFSQAVRTFIRTAINYL